MKILIHACPQRMWYVNEQLAPSLIAQGAEVEIWNDKEGKIAQNFFGAEKRTLAINDFYRFRNVRQIQRII